MLAGLQGVYDELADIHRPEIEAFREQWSDDLLQQDVGVLQFFGDATQQLEEDGETYQLLAVMR